MESVSATWLGDELVLKIDGRRFNLGRLKPKDGRAPTEAEIEAAASKWLSQHRAELVGPPGADATEHMVAAAVSDWLSRNPPKHGAPGEPGKDAEPPSVELLSGLAEQAAIRWLESNREQLRGEPGEPGAPGATPDPVPPAPPLLLPSEPGPMGPMPRHQWDGTRLRFEQEPGIWGGWKDLKGKDAKPAKQVGGIRGMTREEVLALIEETAMQRYDDYLEIEYLPDQLGNGLDVLTFTFSAPVQFVVVEMVSLLDQEAEAEAIEALEGRVTTGATIPATDLGAILKHRVPVSLLAITSTVQVLCPDQTRITVYGKRRPAG